LLEEKCGPASSALGIRISASFEQKPNNLQYLQSAKALPSHQETGQFIEWHDVA
jgi:hypothetical protein